jgi:hypothetical protein
VTVVRVDTPHGRANAHLHRADRAHGGLILGHCAAGGVASRDLVAQTNLALSKTALANATCMRAAGPCMVISERISLVPVPVPSVREEDAQSLGLVGDFGRGSIPAASMESLFLR